MKKLFITSILIMQYCMSVNADELYTFTNVFCNPINNYMIVSSESVYDIGGNPYGILFINSNEDKTYSVTEGSESCKLKNASFEIKVKHYPSRATGRCGGSPPETLRLNFNGSQIFETNNYNNTCWNTININKVIISPYYGKDYFIKVCGLKYLREKGLWADFCVFRAINGRNLVSENINDSSIKESLDERFPEK